MNKKLMFALLLPLMVMPLIGFGYAHWTDKVTKQIKMHAGTVEVEIVQWHVDRCNSYDVNCNGEIFGDELIVEVLTEDGQVVEILITADPVGPCWFLEFKFLIHNKGRLAVDSWEHHVGWVGPLPDDPCWLTEADQPYPDSDPPPGITYTEELFLHDYGTYPACRGVLCTDKTHYTIGPVDPTTYFLKPSEAVLVKEFIHFAAQDYPEYQCHWFRLAKEMVFKQRIGDEWGSEGWTKP